MSDKKLDREKRSAFANRISGILQASAANLAISIGYRCELFSAMHSFNGEQFTSTTLAEKVKGSERYIREWLCVLATANIVELAGDKADEPRNQAFTFPEEHASVLARSASRSMPYSIFSYELDMVAASTYNHMPSRIIGDKQGEGIGYEHYAEFHKIMADMSAAKHNRAIIKNLKTDFPEMHKALAAGGVRVLDVGCGEGVAVRLLAKEFPKSTFVGVDIARSAIDDANALAAKDGLDNTTFVQCDAARMCESKDAAVQDHLKQQSFDWVTAHDSIHDQSHPQAVLNNISTLLKPSGTFSMIDLAAETPLADNMQHPWATFLYTVSLTHCMAVALNDKGTGLGNMWGKQKAEQMLREAGFTSIGINKPTGDGFNYEYRCKL